MNPPEGSKPGDSSHVKVSRSRGLAFAFLEAEFGVFSGKERKRASDGRIVFAASWCQRTACCAAFGGSYDGA